MAVNFIEFVTTAIVLSAVAFALSVMFANNSREIGKGTSWAWIVFHVLYILGWPAGLILKAFKQPRQHK